MHLKAQAYQKENAITSVTIENNSRAKVYLHRAKHVDIPSLPVARFDLLLPTTSNTYRDDIESAIVEKHPREKPGYASCQLPMSNSKTQLTLSTPATTPNNKQSGSSNSSKMILINGTQSRSDSNLLKQSNSRSRSHSGDITGALQSSQFSSPALFSDSSVVNGNDRRGNMASESLQNVTESDDEEEESTVVTPPSCPSEYFLERRQASYRDLEI